MLDASKRILELWNNDEFEIFIVEGKNGYGKTTYANRIISEVYSKDGIHGNWDINMFKQHIGFHPQHVTNRFFNMRNRDKVFHWDDAAVWLNALDYQDPYVKDVGKYLQTARDDWACIIFSCIDKEDVFKKLRNFKSSVVVDITKKGAEPRSPEPGRRYRRTATAYHYWKDRLGKVGTENDWEETFNCHVPDPFHRWYRPLRREYSKLAKKLMRDKLKDKKEIQETKNILNF